LRNALEKKEETGGGAGGGGEEESRVLRRAKATVSVGATILL
jgi:hypothetical protein